VEIADEATDELVDAFARLVPQLSSSSPPLSPEHLAEIVASPATQLLVARDDAGTVVGSLTLVVFRIPTGVRAWIEDIDVATERGARSVDLTSRPSREAANRLYQRLGFEPRETNVYRYQGKG
jgi:hypothetical protein